MKKLTGELKEAYDFTCAACGYEQCARPSMMMEFAGINSGHGSCLNCGAFLHLEIEPDGEFMISQVWDEYLAEREKA